MKQAVKPITIGEQMMSLRIMYSSLIDKIFAKRSELNCIMRLQPSETSIVYKVKIWFKIGDWPKVWLLEPKELAQVDGKDPHHIYGFTKRGYVQLCVFYPGKNEWQDSMYLSKTFVPWIITWLSSYEYWQITGQWVYPEARSLKNTGVK